MRLQLRRNGITLWWGDNHPIWKSINLQCNPGWIKMPWTWLHCSTNGAKKGADSCLDVNIHFFIFSFSYTDWSYWRYKKDSKHGSPKDST